MEKRLRMASWLFLIGSGLFLFDALSEVRQAISFGSLRHFTEGLLFFVGSIFFMPTASDAAPSSDRALSVPETADRDTH